LCSVDVDARDETESRPRWRTMVPMAA
jgi:hypothetical protein